MEQRVDLHLHSSVSIDGELLPEELVRICAIAGLDTVALADHNSVRGVAKAKSAALSHGIRLISGIELDCVFNGHHLHILGYGIDVSQPVFTRLEEEILKQERHAGGLRIELLRKLGIQMDGTWLCDHANNGVITGELIAEAALYDGENKHNPLLVPYRPGGSRSDNPYYNFSADFCAAGKPAFVPIRYMQAPQAIQMIHACGGIAVLSHPGRYGDCGPAMLDALAGWGLDGIEVYSSYHTPTQTAYYRTQGDNRQWLQTCGSDFHGKAKPAIRPGEFVCDGAAGLADTLVEQIGRSGNLLAHAGRVEGA